MHLYIFTTATELDRLAYATAAEVDRWVYYALIYNSSRGGQVGMSCICTKGVKVDR